MKWVRCVYKGSIDRLTVGKIDRLTVGKIYEVLNQSDIYQTVRIITDNGEILTYFMIIKGCIIWFEDATAEIRDMKLNKILEDERYTIEVSE
jgi:hypothetical protein